jgi:HIV Tat-specific factor 1
LADWDDDEPSTVGSNSTKWEKLVYLKHMFTLKELEVTSLSLFGVEAYLINTSLQEDAAAILDIKEDIREECSKLGEVTNVILFDKEADGVASVRFSTPQAAAACIRVMNGRHFAGQRVEAKIADGTERYKRTSEKKVDLDGDEDVEESRRLDQFGAWLEAERGGAAPNTGGELTS